ncbi:MAG: Na+/H+ antiporter NhaA, partial [Actinobacteria bacterium]|nr:Na+/H+ antiporter NhaA [Actinomycetota bacterium]
MTERRVVFGRLAWAERVRLSEILRREVVGGVLLLIAAAVALIWANSAWRDAYFELTQVTIGPQSWGLHLTLADWAGEGLLALFFFVAGLELKRELVVGSLRNRSDAILPIAAAIGGMALPALIYVAFTSSTPGAGQGWGIPIATDIAFALAVLAIIGRGLPPALRAFLLTLAVVDDLGAITVIALFYSDALAPLWLFGSVALVIVYLILQRQRVQSPLVYVPLALALWGFVHTSGIHATVAGVVLGLATRVVRDSGEELAPAERLEERLRPISAGFAVPVFAFFAAGVTVVGTSLSTIASNPVTQGVAVGLVAGKCIGI